MNTKKILIGGLAAGIVYFLLGWLMYGKLFKDFFHTNGAAVDRPDDQIIFWALIAGNLLLGLLVAFIVVKTNSTTAASGFGTGFVVGLLMSAGNNLIGYGVVNVMNLTAICADIAIATVMTAIGGAVVGLISGGSKPSTAT